MAAGFGIWCVGQMLGVYFGSILNLSTQQLWFVDVFYNVWTAPLLMALFLDPEAESEEVNWSRILDFAQVGIVVLLVYVYFSHLAANGGVQSWTLALATDGLITAGQARQILSGEWIVSIDRLVGELGFVPRHALRPGWAETIAWYRSAGWLRTR